jgi:tetratricopeptide (TPR) repeat protein
MGRRHDDGLAHQGCGDPDVRPGNDRETVGCLEQSLTLARAIGDRRAVACALYTLGEVRRLQGRLEEATSCLEGSLATFHDFGFRPWEARALTSLGMLLVNKVG